MTYESQNDNQVKPISFNHSTMNQSSNKFTFASDNTNVIDIL
jgi:hypothetical protein